MKHTIVKLLIAVLLIGALVAMFASCGLGGASEFTVTIKDGDKTLKTLTFDKDATIEIDLDDTALLKPGYEVDALYTDAALTAKFEGTPTATADLTLYVKYEPRPFKIIVIDDPNSTNYRQVDVTYGAAYEITPPTREGYVFLGYTHVQDGAPVAFPLSGTYDKTNTISVSGQWKKLAAITVFDELTDEQVGTVIYADAEGNFTLPAVTDTNAGYNFGGYVIPGVTLTKQNDGTYTGKVTSDGNLTATRKWTEVPKYTLIVNGLEGDDAMDPAAYATGATFTLPVAPTRDGYRFKGYTVGGEALTVGANGEVTFTWSAATTITAVWEYIPKVTVMNGTTPVGATFALPADGHFTLDAVGNTAENNFRGYTGPAGFTATYNATTGKYDCVYTGTTDLTVYYSWEGVRYIVFESNGPAVAPILIVDGVTEYTLPTLADTDAYYFIGFKKGNDTITGTFTLAGDDLDGDGDVTLTAVYQKKVFIRFHDGTTWKACLVEQDGDYTLEAPTAEGKTFVRFTRDSDLFPLTGNYEGTEDLTIIVEWYVIPTFNWSVDANGGAFAPNTTTNGTAYESTEIELPTPTLEGHNFVGYYYGDGIALVKNGDKYVLPAYADVEAKNLVLIAKWEIQTGALGWQTNSDGKIIGYYREENGGEIIHVFLTNGSFYFPGGEISFGGDTSAIEPKRDGEKYGFLAKAPGTFTMTQNGVTIKCRVEYAITSAGEGSNTASRNEANFKGKIDTVLDAGHTNFLPDIVAGTVSLDKIPLKGITIERVDTTDPENPIYAPLEDAEDKYTLLPNGAINFDDTLIGATLRITYTPKYALPEDIANGEALASVTVKLNGGVNVYTNDELYAEYSNLNTRVINILRNITAAMQAEHCAHGHPVGCCYEFERLGSDADPVPINEYKHGVYTRTYDKWYDSLTVNGNCYTIDGSKLPKVDGRKKPSSYDGLFVGTGYASVNMQIGIFTCYANYDTSSDTAESPEVTFNDLYIVGNFDGDSTETIPVTGEQYQLIAGSMSFDGFVVRSGYLNLNNVTMVGMHKAIHSTGFANAPYDGENDLKAAYTPARLETKVILTDVKITESFANALFAWGQVQAELYNCEFARCSGPAIVFSDTDITKTAYDAGYGSKLTFGVGTTVENYVSGTEAWFQAYGVAGQVGKMEQVIDSQLGGAATSKKNGLFNLVLAVNAASDTRFPGPGTYQEYYEDHYEAPCIDIVFPEDTPTYNGLYLFPISGGADAFIPVGDSVFSEAILPIDSKMAGMQLLIQVFAPN